MQKNISLNENEIKALQQILRSQIRSIQSSDIIGDGMKQESIDDINILLDKLNIN